MKNKLILFNIFISIAVLIGIYVTYPIWQTKIAIVYIATGRYIDFWDTFYYSAEKNFVPGIPKHYFVFTDNTTRQFPQNVTRIYLKQLGWPYIALMRYHIVDGIKEKLKPFNYSFLFNANAVVVDRLGPEILPSKEHELIATKHPHLYDTKPEHLPFENHPNSAAFVPQKMRKFYFQSGFSGGRTDAYLKMNALLKKRVQSDLDKDIIAIWHDESHYNWFMSRVVPPPRILGPNYIFGSNMSEYSIRKFSHELKVIMLAKETALFGGHECMRGQIACPRPYNYKEVESGKLIYIIHPHWINWLEFKNDNQVCHFNTSNCAPATRNGQKLKVDWNSGSETFIQTNADFVFTLEGANE